MDKITKTDAQWREELSELEYKVMRKHGTERAFSHDDFPKAPGTFACKGCGRPLFDAETKFDSGTGWPSFYAPLSDDDDDQRHRHDHMNSSGGRMARRPPPPPAALGARTASR